MLIAWFPGLSARRKPFRHGGQKPERILEAIRILELANKAYFLYLRQAPAEKAKLLRIVLSNCALDAVSVYPTYRKLFDLIFQAGKTGEWRPRRDLNRASPHRKRGVLGQD